MYFFCIGDSIKGKEYYTCRGIAYVKLVYLIKKKNLKVTLHNLAKQIFTCVHIIFLMNKKINIK